eukprot:5943383-Amphidinium_carterae.1
MAVPVFEPILVAELHLGYGQALWRSIPFVVKESTWIIFPHQTCPSRLSLSTDLYKLAMPCHMTIVIFQ